jgi:uncharacterized protein
MENFLVVGANTRPVACSLKKLGCKVFSADYFGTQDLRGCADDFRSLLNQKPHQSCGHFTERFNTGKLEELAQDFVDPADFIICLSGSSPLNFPKKKVLGNKDIEKVENKYKLYKKLKNQFKLPKTYLISDGEEAGEITENFPEKRFILKPLYGSGGYGIKEFNKINGSELDSGMGTLKLDSGIRKSELDSGIRKSELNSESGESELNSDFSGFIFQELVEGENISVSVLSTGEEVRTILTSRQILGDADLGQMEPYGYCGNITPLPDDYDVREEAEDVVKTLKLVGSNGVDLVYKDGEIYIIEVNPRFQGTLECAEASLGINMAKAHIEACRGTLMDVPAPQNFAVKMIAHARDRVLVGKLDFQGVYDIPIENVVIEKGEPVATVVISHRILENAVYSAEKLVERVYSSIKPYPINLE